MSLTVVYLIKTFKNVHYITIPSAHAESILVVCFNIWDSRLHFPLSPLNLGAVFQRMAGTTDKNRSSDFRNISIRNKGKKIKTGSRRDIHICIYMFVCVCICVYLSPLQNLSRFYSLMPFPLLTEKMWLFYWNDVYEDKVRLKQQQQVENHPYPSVMSCWSAQEKLQGIKCYVRPIVLSTLCLSIFSSQLGILSQWVILKLSFLEPSCHREWHRELNKLFQIHKTFLNFFCFTGKKKITLSLLKLALNIFAPNSGKTSISSDTQHIFPITTPPHPPLPPPRWFPSPQSYVSTE